MDLLATTLFMLYAFGAVFVICEVEQLQSNHFEEFIDIIEQFKWYLFPMEIKRILPTIIINTQQPVSTECFGSIACNRDTFKRVSYKATTIFNLF